MASTLELDCHRDEAINECQRWIQAVTRKEFPNEELEVSDGDDDQLLYDARCFVAALSNGKVLLELTQKVVSFLHQHCKHPPPVQEKPPDDFFTAITSLIAHFCRISSNVTPTTYGLSSYCLTLSNHPLSHDSLRCRCAPTELHANLEKVFTTIVFLGSITNTTITEADSVNFPSIDLSPFHQIMPSLHVSNDSDESRNRVIGVTDSSQWRRPSLDYAANRRSTAGSINPLRLIQSGQHNDLAARLRESAMTQQQMIDYSQQTRRPLEEVTQPLSPAGRYEQSGESVRTGVKRQDNEGALSPGAGGATGDWQSSFSNWQQRRRKSFQPKIHASTAEIIASSKRSNSLGGVESDNDVIKKQISRLQSLKFQPLEEEPIAASTVSSTQTLENNGNGDAITAPRPLESFSSMEDNSVTAVNRQEDDVVTPERNIRYDTFEHECYIEVVATVEMTPHGGRSSLTPNDAATAKSQLSSGVYFGMGLSGGRDDCSPVLLEKILPGSAVDELSVSVGDHLASINGEKTSALFRGSLHRLLQQCWRNGNVCFTFHRYRNGFKPVIGPDNDVIPESTVVKPAPVAEPSPSTIAKQDCVESGGQKEQITSSKLTSNESIPLITKPTNGRPINLPRLAKKHHLHASSLSPPPPKPTAISRASIGETNMSPQKSVNGTKGGDEVPPPTVPEVDTSDAWLMSKRHGHGQGTNIIQQSAPGVQKSNEAEKENGHSMTQWQSGLELMKNRSFTKEDGNGDSNSPADGGGRRRSRLEDRDGEVDPDLALIDKLHAKRQEKSTSHVSLLSTPPVTQPSHPAVGASESTRRLSAGVREDKMDRKDSGRAASDIRNGDKVSKPSSSASQESHTVSSREMCSHCSEKLGAGSAMAIDALNLYYHMKCFKCSVCGVTLGSGLQGTDVRVKNNRLHCQNCNSSSNVRLSKV